MADFVPDKEEIDVEKAENTGYQHFLPSIPYYF